MPDPTFIASCDLLWLQSDGSEVAITARVGVPYRPDGREYRCPAETVGLHGRYPDICGEDSMQSLCLAIGLVATQLEGLLDRGERLVHPGDRSCAVDRAFLKTVFGR